MGSHPNEKLGARSTELATASPSERRTGSGESARRFSYQSISYLLIVN